MMLSELRKTCERCRTIPELKTKWHEMLEAAIFTEETRMVYIRELIGPNHSGGAKEVFIGSKRDFLKRQQLLKEACALKRVHLPNFSYLDVLLIHTV